jgi:hypothetical protein
LNFTLNCKPKKLLQEIFQIGFSGGFPNVTVAVMSPKPPRLHASVASGRSSNALKQNKNCHSSTMGQDNLNGAMLCGIAGKLYFSTFTGAFAQKIARKLYVK